MMAESSARAKMSSDFFILHLCVVPGEQTSLILLPVREVSSMPVRDIYHDAVRRALIKDGWTITHDPLRLDWGGTDMYVDLGAERLLAAEKGEQRIAIEIKSFIGAS